MWPIISGETNIKMDWKNESVRTSKPTTPGTTAPSWITVVVTPTTTCREKKSHFICYTTDNLFIWWYTSFQIKPQTREKLTQFRCATGCRVKKQFNVAMFCGGKMHLEWIFSYGKMSWTTKVCVWLCFVSSIIWRKPGTYACDSCLWTWLPLHLHVYGTLRLLLQSTCHWGRNQCGLAADLMERRTKGEKMGH